MKRIILFWACLQGPILIAITFIFAFEEPIEAFKMAILTELAGFIFAMLLDGLMNLINWSLNEKKD